MAALDPGPSVPIRPHFQLLHLLLRKKSSIPRSFLVSSSPVLFTSFFFCPYSWGLKPVLLVCECACVCVYCVCVFRRVGVKASLCLLAGIGSNPGVPFTHLLWKTVVWLLQPHILHPPKLVVSRPIQPPLFPHSQSLHGLPSPPPLLF